MTSDYDDSIWQRIPEADRPLDDELVGRATAFFGGSDSVLDLGCGDGQYLGLLLQHCGQVYGADPSQVALDRAARRHEGARLWLVGSDQRLSLDDNCVDRVWCVDTIEHAQDTQILLSEARRVLVPGGRILVATPAHGRLLRLRLAFSGWDRHFDPFSPHLRFYTARSLAVALAECGFEPSAVSSKRGLLVAEAARD